MIGDGIDRAARFGAFLIKAIDGRTVIFCPTELDAETGGRQTDFGDHEIESLIKFASIILMANIVVRENEMMFLKK